MEEQARRQREEEERVKRELEELEKEEERRHVTTPRPARQAAYPVGSQAVSVFPLPPAGFQQTSPQVLALVQCLCRRSV